MFGLTWSYIILDDSFGSLKLLNMIYLPEKKNNIKFCAINLLSS